MGVVASCCGLRSTGKQTYEPLLLENEVRTLAFHRLPSKLNRVCLCSGKLVRSQPARYSVMC